MAATKSTSQRRPAPAKAAAKKPAARKRSTAAAKVPDRARAVERTTELSDEVLKSLEAGQKAAVDAVRRFVDTVDQALPAIGDRPSRRQEVIDAALEMSEKLIHTQYDFLRKVVQSAGKAMGPDDAKK